MDISKYSIESQRLYANLKRKYKRIVESGGRFYKSLDDLIKEEFKEGTSFKRRMEVASRPTWLISQANFLIVKEGKESAEMVSGYEYTELRRRRTSFDVIYDMDKLPDNSHKDSMCEQLIENFISRVNDSYEWSCVGAEAQEYLIYVIQKAINKAAKTEKYPFIFIYENKLNFLDLLPAYLYKKDGFKFNYRDNTETNKVFEYVGENVNTFYNYAESFISAEYNELGRWNFYEKWGDFIR